MSGLDEQRSEEEGDLAVTAEDGDAHVCHVYRVQTSTHGLTIGEHEVRKEFVDDHEAEAEREWAILTLLAEHAPGLAPRPSAATTAGRRSSSWSGSPVSRSRRDR